MAIRNVASRDFSEGPLCERMIVVSRLNPGTVLAGIFAVLFALAAAYVVRSFLERKPEPAEAKAAAVETTMQVPSASATLLAGRTISLGDIAMRQLEIEAVRKKIDAKELPADFMTNPEQIVGRILREPVKVGDGFSAAIFYAEGTGPSVADKLKPGLRAVTITVSDTGLVSGFASPTTLVDVLFRSEKLDNFPETTFTLIEGIEVLAVGRSSYPNSVRVERVPGDRGLDLVQATLAVTPKQASILRVLEGRGEMSLSLRSPDERSAQTVEADLLAAKGRRSIWAREENLLRQMEELSAKTRTEFKEQDRLKIIATEIETVEIEIERLATELKFPQSESRKLTLAEVLGIPEPPAPVPAAQPRPAPRIDLYLRGQRSSLIFESPIDSAAPVSADPPVSAVTPVPDRNRQNSRASAALTNSGSGDVTPGATKPEQPAALVKTYQDASFTPTSVAQTPTPSTAIGASRADLQPPASASKRAADPVFDGRQADVKRALLEIDERVKDIQTRQERALGQRAAQLADELIARNAADSGAADNSEMTDQAKLLFDKQQADLRLALQQIDQRMHAMQASQELSLGELSSQLVNPLPISDLPAVVRSEMRDSVNQIGKLTDLVEALEKRLLNQEMASTVESTPAQVPEPSANSREFKNAGAPPLAAARAEAQTIELVVGQRGTSKSVNIRTPATREYHPNDTSRSFVWSPQADDKKPRQVGKKGQIEVVLGTKKSAPVPVAQQDQSL